MYKNSAYEKPLARWTTILLTVFLSIFQSYGQYVMPTMTLNFPNQMCAGNTTTMNLNHDITFQYPEFAHYHQRTAIIPNGNCQNGCDYDEIFDFVDFRDSDTIRTVDDIDFLLINMEHSYAGELYIQLICPNNQYADVLRYNRNMLSNDCNNTVNSSNIGWQNGHTNSYEGVYFGYPNPAADVAAPCETFGNMQNAEGTGWNYCWSNSSHYSYAPLDGLIYRDGNQISLGDYHYAFTPSNIQAGTQFYHPDQPFSSLIGCPMNGRWHIRVLDGLQDNDNGYVFLSGIALHPDSAWASTLFQVDSISLHGPWVNGSQAPIFSINPPNTLAHDTLAAYTLTFYNNTGATYDTVLHMLIHSTVYHHDTLTLCQSELPFDFGGNIIAEGTESGTLTFHDESNTGCDSITVLNLTIIPIEVTRLYDTICAGQRYQQNGFNLMGYHEGTLTDFRNEVSQLTGCDSVIYIELTVLPLPHLYISNEQESCNDPFSTLTALPEGLQYQWSNGDTTQSIIVPLAGTYFLTATGDNGCISRDSVSLSGLASPYYAFNIPTDLCSGIDYPFTIGFENDASIVLSTRQASLGVSDTIFLPDGVACDPYGCSYRSPVTFTDFQNNALIEDVNDILYVRLNMEHSFIGDLYISITCPNGQRANILRFCGVGSSNCTNNITQESYGWHDGENANIYFLGLAYDIEDTQYPCDATQVGNQPGIGWNYCWSNNTTAGYTYAPCDGSYVYRVSNAHRRLTPDGSQRWVFDSTNVAQGSNFYHPDQDFASLIGCPMNGSWQIEVLDGWNNDNGYIFEWELALRPDLLSEESFVLDHFTIQGPWVEISDFSTFHINPPATLIHDTIVSYLVTVYDENGCSYDTTLTFQVHPTYHIEIYDTACLGETYQQNGFNISANVEGTYQYTKTISTAVANCDSIITLTLTVLHPGSFSIVNHATSCSANNVTLTVEPAGMYYQWSNGSHADSITVTAPGTYSVMVTDSNGCVATDTTTLFHHDSPFHAINIPNMCAGTAYTLDIGFDITANINLQTQTSTLAVNDTIFLPDGISCNPYGCSYRSPVTFTDFSPNARISNANDILYLRLNIEHSYIGDLYINITCPNGQKADILKFAGTGSSSCISSIPLSSRGWSNGSNSSSMFLGEAYDNGSYSDKCNKNDALNRPGIGWNYCWSNNNNQGYTYSPSLGSYIYRTASSHLHGTTRIADSSDVFTQTNFYHPDQSFSNLIGCPMNGSWYIEVIDGFSSDNGYIFGWELALSPELLPQNEFVIDTFIVDGPWVTPHNGNTFSIEPPSTLTHDTVVTYHITIYDTTGCSFDTIFPVQIWVPRHTFLQENICLGQAFSAMGFNVEPDSAGTYQYTRTLTSIETHCDSIVTLTLEVTAPQTTFEDVTAYDNYTWHGTTYTTSNHTATYTTTDINGCDSVVVLNLTILYSNDTTRVDTTICAYDMPITMFGCVVNRDTSIVYNILRANGSDSVIIYSVHVISNPIVQLSVPTEICANDTLSLSIGYDATASIRLQTPSSTHSDNQRIFIPDGMSCDPYGTYYRSYANFNNFMDGSTLTSANDILYLRLKMEHSAIEDIRISIVCPNGQTCKIVPDFQQDTWGPITTHLYRTNMGLANRLQEENSCDSILNPIGEPWNYVWSNNTTQGYQYAGGQYGYCYENNNIHLIANPYWDAGSVAYVIDSSNVFAMTNIYHPTESFDSLIGCPLNGNWYIQIQDVWENDNGYLTEWELALSPSLVQQYIPAVTSRSLVGPWLNMQNDSLYLITPPVTLSNDSTISYTLSVTEATGCIFDTTFSVVVHPTNITNLYDTVCITQLPYTWQGLQFQQEGTQTAALQNIQGCDSLVYYHLTVINNPVTTISGGGVLYPGASTQLSVSGGLEHTWSPATGLSATFGTSVTATPTGSTFYYVTTANSHCSVTDSIQVLVYTILDTTICENDLPLSWLGETFTDTATRPLVIVNPNGLDDAFLLHVAVNHNSAQTLHLTIVENELPYDTLGLHFIDEGEQQALLTNTVGCDSLVTVILSVNWNTNLTIDTTLCQHDTPFLWFGQALENSGTYTHTTSAVSGADSIITLNLTVNPTYEINEVLELCRYELPYFLEAANVTIANGSLEHDTITYTLPTVEGCDSIITVAISILGTHLEIISDTPDFCNTLSAVLEVVSDMPNYTWSTGETSSSITVSSPGTYSVTGTNGNCQAEASYAVLPCDMQFLLPNAFSPNGDGLNDYFCINEHLLFNIGDDDFEIAILNRWGEVIYLSNNKHFHWDGSYKGVVHHNVTYNYLIRYSNEFGRQLIHKGSILVL